MTLREIADLLEGEIDGSGSVDIIRVAKIEEAGEGDITFIANPKYAKHIGATAASCVIVSRDFSPPSDSAHLPVLIRVSDPYVAFMKILQEFHPTAPPLPEGIHPSAVIGKDVRLGAGVRIGAHVVIGTGTHIGDRAIIGHGVVLGDGVTIGDGTILYHNVTVYYGCRIGARVIIHAGTVVGSDGFGFAPRPDGTFEKIPQMGIVVVEDDVEIGSNCSLDRATMGETRVRRGAKLDNLIQVAHNVVIGENTVIAAQSGISGSTKIGANVMIAGQVGLTGHLEIADRTKLGAQSGIHRSITKPGQTYFGTPAYPHREAFRMQGAATQLPDLLVTVRELTQTVRQQEETIKSLKETVASLSNH
jgi:UDP-3-O-[3-hydroxymyristoyl] glucosamine N-acyltransferase